MHSMYPYVSKRQPTIELSLSLGQFRNGLSVVLYSTAGVWFSELPDQILYVDYSISQCSLTYKAGFSNLLDSAIVSTQTKLISYYLKITNDTNGTNFTDYTCFSWEWHCRDRPMCLSRIAAITMQGTHAGAPLQQLLNGINESHFQMKLGIIRVICLIRVIRV